jgi:hypothetical protein
VFVNFRVALAKSYNEVNMGEKVPIKVVIETALLERSRNDIDWQRVSTVYMGHEEFRVMAPPKANGDPLDWLHHLVVRHMGWQGYTDVSKDVIGVLAIRETEAELQNLKRNAGRVEGMNPDGVYYDAHICHSAHVQSIGGDVPKSQYCGKCGSPVIADCPDCKTPIRGHIVNSKDLFYTVANFCHNCGKAYPWMEDRLKTAHELLNNDDKLQLEERKELWGLLQYVMSSPKADLAPAKRKLIDIKLGKAAQVTRELVLDFLAKVMVESVK